jgi:uncharacterized protein (TIGR02611 family)
MTVQPFVPLRSSAATRLTRGPSGAGMTIPWLRWARKGGITVAGIAIMAAGVAMLVLPGPGVAVILLGLAVLASEYDWAARLLATLRQRAARMARPLAERLRRKRPTTATGLDRIRAASH